MDGKQATIERLTPTGWKKLQTVVLKASTATSSTEKKKLRFKVPKGTTIRAVLPRSQAGPATWPDTASSSERRGGDVTEGGGNLGQAAEIAGRLLANIETVVHGKTDEVRLVLAALVCDGHVLLEDVPGTAKTVLARAIAGSVDGASFARIQCTPDLQPTDVTGLSVFNQRDRDFEFRPGPVFANVLLVDEINRAMPKTQSALLEAMAEYQATIDGVTRELPKPFLVLATENPIEQEGTFPLPEAQLDRFLLRTALGYPGEEEELRIVEEQVERHPLSGLAPVLSLDEVNVLREAAHGVYIDPAAPPLGDPARARDAGGRGVAIGASVRGSLALERSARAWALLSGREFVTTVDIERLFLPVVMHRIVFTPSFVATAREIGWQEAADAFRASASRSRRRPGWSWSRRFRHEADRVAGWSARGRRRRRDGGAVNPVTLSLRQYTNTGGRGGARPPPTTSWCRSTPHDVPGRWRDQLSKTILH